MRRSEDEADDQIDRRKHRLERHARALHVDHVAHELRAGAEAQVHALAGGADPRVQPVRGGENPGLGSRPP